ncbi:uncharacterized protein VTP21DRAFT_11234 [Calcarisporiella thermophila]|uniref:uncharacterized protein n=1 Tax=Calcarisporiella thermophila TaxID=911321 RepID=UPI0037439C01
MKYLLTVTAFFGVASLAVAAPKGKSEQGSVASVVSADNFCFFLPPKFGGDIAKAEDNAIAFCTKDMKNAPGAKLFPKGFIQSAHFASGKGYVQVTGRIDPSKYGLSKLDEGGQYDVRAPVGASCAGYKSFVNLVEPSDGLYCIRCCDNKKDCNVGRSEAGCESIVPGDYSGPKGINNTKNEEKDDKDSTDKSSKAFVNGNGEVESKSTSDSGDEGNGKDISDAEPTAAENC